MGQRGRIPGLSRAKTGLSGFTRGAGAAGPPRTGVLTRGTWKRVGTGQRPDVLGPRAPHPSKIAGQGGAHAAGSWALGGAAGQSLASAARLFAGPRPLSRAARWGLGNPRAELGAGDHQEVLAAGPDCYGTVEIEYFKSRLSWKTWNPAVISIKPNSMNKNKS